MSSLSIFVDESGDFGPYDSKSPYYIVTMIFHDQSKDINNQVCKRVSEQKKIFVYKSVFLHPEVAYFVQNIRV